jgi:hypothetical protein
MPRKHPHRPATGSDVVQILGPLDDGMIAQILATGATSEEITEARAWLSTRDYFRRLAHDSAHGRIARVYHFLDVERREGQG